MSTTTCTNHLAATVPCSQLTYGGAEHGPFECNVLLLSWNTVEVLLELGIKDLRERASARHSELSHYMFGCIRPVQHPLPPPDHHLHHHHQVVISRLPRWSQKSNNITPFNQVGPWYSCPRSGKLVSGFFSFFFKEVMWILLCLAHSFRTSLPWKTQQHTVGPGDHCDTQAFLPW